MRRLRILALASAVMAVTMAQSGDTKPAPSRSQMLLTKPLGLMSSPRAVHATVTLADGRVALIGGCVLDGCDAGPGSRTVDIFNPKTNRFSMQGPLVSARIGASAVALADGQVLIAGGWSGSGQTASVELFDPATGTSAEIGQLRAPRADMATVTLRDGRVALIGGVSGRANVADVTLFDPRTRRLTEGPALRQPRSRAAVVRLNDGRVLVAGGSVGVGPIRPSASAEIADAALGAWAVTGSLNAARYKHAMVALPDGRALVVGGSDARDREGKIAAIEAFDPARGAFVAAGRTQSLRFKITQAVVVLADGRVLIGGGAERPEIYDPRSRRSALIEPRVGGVMNFATASALPDGRVLIAGGYEEGSIAVSRAVWLVKP